MRRVRRGNAENHTSVTNQTCCIRELLHIYVCHFLICFLYSCAFPLRLAVSFLVWSFITTSSDKTEVHRQMTPAVRKDSILAAV